MSFSVADRLPKLSTTVIGVRQGLLEAILPIWPLLVLMSSFFLLAPEVRFAVIGINLPAYRILALLLSWHWVSALMGRRLRMIAADWLIAAASVWMLVSFAYHYGAGEGIVRGMGVVIDTACIYFLARSCIRTPTHLRILFLFLVPSLLLAGIEMLVESVGKDFVVRTTYGRIFGQLSAYSGGAESGVLELRKEFRLGGLMRAMGPFSHPILGGLILTSTMLIFLTSGIRSWPRYLGCSAAFMGFFALSSASILSLILAFGLFFSDRVLRKFSKISWWILSIFVVFIGLFIEFASKGGLVNLLIRQTLDPQTGYYRKMIWEWGLRSISNNVWFGIGYADYQRPLNLLPNASVDAHFLASGMVFGVFVPVALILAMIIAQIKLGYVVGRAKGSDRNLLFGLNATLFTMMFSSMTVTYFGESRLWFMAFIGMAVSMGQLKFVRQASGDARVDDKPA